MLLEHDRASRARVAANGPGGLVHVDGGVIVDFDPVVPDRHSGRPYPLAICTWGGVEFNVEALPPAGSPAGVDPGRVHAKDGAAIELRGVQAITIQDLDFITALEVNTSVASGLPVGVGHQGHQELSVQVEAPLEFPARH